MKKILMIMLMMSAVTGFSKEITVKVNGMVCSMCAQGIEKKFSDVDSVEKIHVDLDTKVVHILTKGAEDIDDQKITKLITESGYNVASIERK